jgi:HK97 family phage portal protein
VGLIQKFREWREYNIRATQTLEEILLQAGIGTDTITKEQALNIPSVAGCVDIISNTIAMLPIKLYKEENGKVITVKDNRVNLLNLDTKDTLNSFQFKKQIIEDYLLSGAGYAYINKQKNNIASLNYVDNAAVSVNKNADPIFKSYDILVNGNTYRDFEFLKLTRKTKDGVTGKGIVAEHNDMLTLAYLTLKFEKVLMKTGGNKKGFLKAKNKLNDGALTALKTAWNNLYKDNTENVVVLNDGLEFQEASSSSVEMQMNENKRTNSAEICKLFSMPVGILEGNATEQDNANYIKYCILPILKGLETALNKDILLELEKGSFYFATDTKELLKGDILKRYQAYEIAIRSGIQTIDEVRYAEDLEYLGLNFLKLGLESVLFNAKTKDIFVTNTGMTFNMNNTVVSGINVAKGGV